MAQCLYILTLVDDQHDQRTDDIETGNDQNKSQEKIGDQLFYPHDAIGICLLFITVFHPETVAQMFFQLTLDHARIGIRLQFQTDRTDFRGVLEQATGKRQGGQNVGSIVFFLIDGKGQPRGEKTFAGKGRSRIGQVDFGTPLGGIDLKRIQKTDSRTQNGKQLDTGNGIIGHFIVQQQIAAAKQNAVNRGQTVEIVFHTLNDSHSLTSLVLYHRIIFEGFRYDLNLGHAAQCLNLRILSVENLAGDGSDLQFGIECRKVI